MVATVEVAVSLSELFPPESLVSHDILDRAIQRHGLAAFDPRKVESQAGKKKRVRAVVSESARHQPDAGGRLVVELIETLRGYGEFQAGRASPESIGALQRAIEPQGYSLSRDGTLAPRSRDSLDSREMTAALRAYIERARHGHDDAPLVAGTAKDLVEATARHVIQERGGTYNPNMGLVGTLHNAFEALGLATVDLTGVKSIHEVLDDDAIRRLDQCLYLLALAVNEVRKEFGTGHGRPQPARISVTDATTSAEATGLIAARLLDLL
jgi:hypothetical protein